MGGDPEMTMKAAAISVAQAYKTVMAGALVLMMALLFAVMCVQVLFRYGLNASLIWAEEVCRYLLIWVSFLACGVAWQRGEIAAMRVLVAALPARLAALCAALADAAVLGLLGIVTVYGWRYAVFSDGQTMPAADFIWNDALGGQGPAQISLFWVYVAVPVGAALLAVHVAIHLAHCVGAAASGERPLFPGAPEGTE